MENSAKICLVTGASSGIGFAIANALIGDNHTVIVSARRDERLARLATADRLTGDLTDSEFVDSIEDHIYSRYGKCDYLFNCAGIIAVGSVEEMDINKMCAMVRLNVESTFRITYRLLKRFKTQGSGHVINISSVLGTKVRPTAGAYSATKYAMEALSEALRMELSGTNIKITCIEPGLVMTELHKDWEVHPSVSMGIHEPLTVEDIVNSVRYIMTQPDHVRIPKLMILPKDHNI